GFAAIAPVSPSIIKKINSLPGVRMVHANQVKTIFQLPTPADEWFPTSESRTMLEAEAAFREGYNGEAGSCDTMGSLSPVICPSVAANWAGSISTRTGWTGSE
ncbi:unnamed protein product, partial [marine sediment metagenome]